MTLYEYAPQKKTLKFLNAHETQYVAVLSS